MVSSVQNDRMKVSVHGYICKGFNCFFHDNNMRYIFKMAAILNFPQKRKKFFLTFFKAKFLRMITICDLCNFFFVQSFSSELLSIDFFWQWLANWKSRDRVKYFCHYNMTILLYNHQTSIARHKLSRKRRFYVHDQYLNVAPNSWHPIFGFFRGCKPKAIGR